MILLLVILVLALLAGVRIDLSWIINVLIVIALGFVIYKLSQKE